MSILITANMKLVTEERFIREGPRKTVKNNLTIKTKVQEYNMAGNVRITLTLRSIRSSIVAVPPKVSLLWRSGGACVVR
jgi:hypothetical protein